MVPEPFKEGGEVPVTLEFEKAGKVDLKLPVTGLRRLAASPGIAGTD